MRPALWWVRARWRATAGAEELAQLRSEQLGLLGGGEVSAAWHLGPARDVVGHLGPFAWAGDRVLLRKQCDPDRHVDSNGLWRLGVVPAVVVEEGGRRS